MGTCSPFPAPARSPSPWFPWRLLGWVAFGAVYLVTASLSLGLANQQTLTVPVWLPAGLAMAVLLRVGWRGGWRPLALASLTEATLHHDSWVAALGAGIGNVLGPVIGAFLAEWFAGGIRFGKNPRHLFRFAGLGAGASGVVGSALGVSGLAMAREIPMGGAWMTFLNWAMAGAVGTLILTPLLLAWGRPLAWRKLPLTRWLEVAALGLACVVGTQFAFGGWPFGSHPDALAPLVILLLLWAAFRFPGRGVMMSIAVIAGLAIGDTLGGHGPFAAALWLPDRGAIINLQAFLGCTSLMALATASVVREGDAQAAAQEEAVVRRTTEIQAANDQLLTELAERRRAEEALRANRAMLRLVIDMIPQAVWWKDRNSVYLGCNHALARAARLDSSEEIIGRTDYDLPWPREQTEHDRSMDWRVIHENRPELRLLERRRRTDDAMEAWLEINKVPLHDAAGEVVGVLGTSEDVTARRRIEEELRAAHAKLEARVAERTAELARANEDLRREIAERARSAVALRDKEHRLRLALEAGNMSAWRIEPEANLCTWFHFKGDASQLAAAFPSSLNAFAENVHPEDRERVMAALAQCRETGQRVAVLYRYRSPLDGAERWIETSGRAVCDEAGRAEFLVGVSLDVTERRRAEEALRASKLDYRSLFELNPLPTWVYEVSTLRFLAVNAAAVERYGYTREEFLALTIDDLRPTKDQERPRDHLEFQPEQGLQKTGRWKHRKKNGVLIDVEIASDALLFAGRPAHVVVAEDVTERKRSEDALRESEHCLRLALEAGRMSVWRIDQPTGDVTWSVSGHPHEDQGWSSETFPPSFQEFIQDVHPEDRAPVLAAIERCKREGQSIFAQYRFLRRRDGQMRWLESRGQATRDAAGNVETITGLSLDITSRKEQEALLNARANQQRVIAMLGQCALIGLNIDSLLQEAVDLVVATLGVDASAVGEHHPARGEFTLRAGHGFPEGWVGRFLAKDEPGTGARLALHGSLILENVQTETRFRTAKFLEELGVVSVAAVVIAGERADQPFGSLGAYTRTARQFTEDDVTFLQAVANILAAAIERQRVEATLETARREAERANDAKSEFLSRMSHELRTPLNAILGFGQLLEVGGLTAEHLESVDYILRAGRHLLGLIDEVLDVARIESGRLALSLEPVSLGELLAETLQLLKPLAMEHGVRLPAPEAMKGADYHVAADRQRLKQILVNLLSNSIKFNQPGGEVRLAWSETESTPTCQSRVRLEVRDTGRGLEGEDLSRLFTPFERLGAGRTDAEGAGIGLILSRQLLESMGGTISVESEMGIGTVFFLELPRSEPLVTKDPANGGRGELCPTAVLIADKSSRDEQGLTQTVLYIEDNLPNLQLVERVFERLCLSGRRLQLLRARDGELGLKLAREHGPDLILLDLQLPDMAGGEVLAQLRADPATCLIPVIVLSADATPDQIQNLLAAGAAGYVTKPLELNRFLELLEATLEPTRERGLAR